MTSPQGPYGPRLLPAPLLCRLLDAGRLTAKALSAARPATASSTRWPAVFPFPATGLALTTSARRRPSMPLRPRRKAPFAQPDRRFVFAVGPVAVTPCGGRRPEVRGDWRPARSLRAARGAAGIALPANVLPGRALLPPAGPPASGISPREPPQAFSIAGDGAGRRRLSVPVLSNRMRILPFFPQPLPALALQSDALRRAAATPTMNRHRRARPEPRRGKSMISTANTTKSRRPSSIIGERRRRGPPQIIHGQ